LTAGRAVRFPDRSGPLEAEVDAREHGVSTGRRDLRGQSLQALCAPGAHGELRADELSELGILNWDGFALGPA
jgi:hypothetical protein